MQNSLGLQGIQTGIDLLPPLQRPVPQSLQQGVAQAAAVPQGDDPVEPMADGVPQAELTFWGDAVQKPQPQPTRAGAFGDLPQEGFCPVERIPQQKGLRPLPPVLPQQGSGLQQAVGLGVMGRRSGLEGIERRGLSRQLLAIQNRWQGKIVPVAAGKGGLEHMGRRSVQQGQPGQGCPVQRVGVGGTEKIFLRAAQCVRQPANAGGFAAAGAALDGVQPSGALPLELGEQRNETSLGIGAQKEETGQENRPFAVVFGPFYGGQTKGVQQKSHPFGWLWS